MSTAIEQTRALIWAGGLLVQISRDKSLPLALRRQATTIARHFPTAEEICRQASESASAPEGLERSISTQFEEWVSQLEDGPLRGRTRLAWPD